MRSLSPSPAQWGAVTAHDVPPVTGVVTPATRDGGCVDLARTAAVALFAIRASIRQRHTAKPMTEAQNR